MLGGPSCGGGEGSLLASFLVSLACGYITPISASVITRPSPCVSLSRFPLISTLVIRVGPTRVQCDLILTSYI